MSDKRIPCYLTVYNRWTWAKEMAAQCEERFGLRVIILDNDSQYPPCQEWFDRCSYEVIHVGTNASCRGFWHCKRHLEQTGWYIVSDTDLDLTNVPDDAVGRLIDVYKDYRDVTKVGLSLELNDVPDTYLFYDTVMTREKVFWQNRRDHRGFLADIETTFALYSPKRPALLENKFFRAIRLDRPYTARHLDWYTDLDNLNEEDSFYIAKCNDMGVYSPMARRLLGKGKGVNVA